MEECLLYIYSVLFDPYSQLGDSYKQTDVPKRFVFQAMGIGMEIGHHCRSDKYWLCEEKGACTKNHSNRGACFLGVIMPLGLTGATSPPGMLIGPLKLSPGF